MADINALPKEILDHVISFMDDSTQLVSRLTSTQWFKQIRYSDFQLTKIRDEHLEAVATRLSQYDRPISLTFHNSPRRRLANIIGALTKLTNVQSLTLGRLDRQNNEKDWLKMTCLTNLKYFSAEGLIIPTAFYLHMTWLRNFSDNGLVPLSDAKQIFQSLPNIDSVHYYPNEKVVDAFELVKSLSRLTKLAFSHPECETMNEENTKALANLKVFRWGNYYSTTTDGNQMPLRHMTRLEDLQILVPFRSITSTHLTRIVVSDKAIESLVQNYSKLNNLKILDVRFEGEVESFNAALESFTALEELCLLNCPSEGYCSIYNLVKSTNLTSLELQQWRPTVPLTLTTLTALVLSVDDPVDCSLFSNLVNLTSLQNYSNNMRGTFPSSITKLRDLSWTDTHQVQLDLSLLPHLEYLDIVIGKSNALEGLERATNLKSLTMNSPSNTVVDFKFLSSLTLLQNLSITYIICQNFWPQLRGLTNLRTLAVPRMEREDQILYLTNMGKLREFTTMAQYVAGIHLTRLTSLQSLSFKSDMAARSIAVNSLYKALTRLVTHNF